MVVSRSRPRLAMCAVRVMDDLATAERSRWEVWHELHHGRFTVEEFIRIAREEMNYIRRDLGNGNHYRSGQMGCSDGKMVWGRVPDHVAIDDRSEPAGIRHRNFCCRSQWNPCGLESDPLGECSTPEFCKSSNFQNTLRTSTAISKFAETSGSRGRWRAGAVGDTEAGKKIVLGFSFKEVVQAAEFHGNIGDPKRVLDVRAASEQARVLADGAEIRNELKELGAAYLKKFGVKFLISAKRKSAADIKDALKRRMNQSGGRGRGLNNALKQRCGR